MDNIIHVVRRQTQGRVTYGPAFTTRALLDLHYPGVEVQAMPVKGDLNGCKKLYGHVTPGERAQQLLGVFTAMDALKDHAARNEVPAAAVEIRLEA